ncbi:MAG: hypothetical protein JW747_03860 [Candidatus Aminicenantes bacterium]|nr:hypothetical protein [Candidatus Aminicenantes bacterium]
MSWTVGSGLLGLVIEFALKSAAVLSLALLAAAFLRGRSASLRHFILSFSLIGLLLIPVLSFLFPGWETPFLPSRPAGISLIPAQGEERLLLEESSFGPVNVLSQISPAGSASTLAGNDAALRPGAAESFAAGRLTGFLLLAAWTAGLLLILLRMGFGLREASRLTREGKSLDDSAWRMLLERFLSLIRLGRRVVLKSHPRVAVPLTWGWRKPVILMPEEARSWEERRRSTALLHELSHVKRADFLVMILVRLSLALFWFNPLTWIVLGKMKKEQEKACDEWVLRSGVKPSAYAAHLLSFQKRRGGLLGPSIALLGLFEKSGINDRLFAILRQKLTFKEVTMKAKMMMSLAVVLAVIFVGTARPSAARTETGGDAVLLAEAMPGSGPAPAAAAQEKQAVKEDEKPAKKKAEKTVVVTTGGDQSDAVELVVTEGETENRMTLDSPVILKKINEPERSLVVLSEGKEVLTVKGDVRLEVKAPSTTVEGKTIVLEGGRPLFLVTEKDKGKKKREIRVVTEPHVKIIREGDTDVDIFVLDKAGKAKSLALSKALRLPHSFNLEFNESQVREMLEQVRESLEAIDWKDMGLREVLEKYRSALAAVEEPQLQKKLQDVFENLESDLAVKIDIQEKTLAKLEESLKKLSEKLKAEERLPQAYAIAKKNSEGSTDEGLKEIREITVTTITDESGTGMTASVVKVGLKDAERKAFDQAVENMRGRLPEGFTLESKFDDKTGTAVAKIKGPTTEKKKIENLLQEFLKILGEEEPPIAVLKKS